MPRSDEENREDPQESVVDRGRPTNEDEDALVTELGPGNHVGRLRTRERETREKLAREKEKGLR